MKSFHVNCEKMNLQSDLIAGCSHHIDEMINEVHSIRSDLRTKIIIKSNIGNNLKAVETKLSLEKNAASTLGKNLHDIACAYKQTEQSLLLPYRSLNEGGTVTAAISEHKVPLSKSPYLQPEVKYAGSADNGFHNSLSTETFINKYLKSTGTNGASQKTYKDKLGNEYALDENGTLYEMKSGFIGGEADIDKAIRILEAKAVCPDTSKDKGSFWDQAVDYAAGIIDDIINDSLEQVKIPELRRALKLWVDTNNITGLIRSANDGYIHGDSNAKRKFWIDGICTNLPDYYNYAYTAITELADSLVANMDKRKEELADFFNGILEK